MTRDELKRLIERSTQHNFLYHFTDEANFPLTKQHGLLSKQKLTEAGIAPVAPGGNDWSWQADGFKGLLGFVNLCFTRSHPMCYAAKQEGRIANPRYLAISPHVLDTPGLKISFDIANKSGVDILDFEHAIGELDSEVLYTRTDWRDPDINARLRRAERFEILVPDAVPVSLIKGVF